jgi:hypothetical protein
MKVLRVTFLSGADRSAQVMAATLFLQELQNKGLRCSAEDGKTLDIVVSEPREILEVGNILTKRTDLEWEVVGPRCPDHGSYTTSAYQRDYGEIWKCFGGGREGCRHQVVANDFLSMTRFLSLRNNKPVPITKKEEEEKPSEEVVDALLYVYRNLVHTPRNWRQFGDASKAAYALQNGVPVAFEAVPEQLDKLEEVVWRAKGRNPAEGMKFIVQIAPQAHVLPAPVLEMAKSLRGLTKKIDVAMPVNPMWGPSPAGEVRRLLGLKESLQKQISELRAKLDEVTSERNDIEKAGKLLVCDHEALTKAADKLLRTVAGLNLQDQSLGDQREVREALHAVMKALRNGEEPR